VRSMAPELNGSACVTFLVREVAPKLKESPGPMQREWERVSGPIHVHWWQIRGVIGGWLTGAHKRAAVEDIVHGRGGVIPRSEIAGTKPPYVCPGCFIQTYSNNMINRFHVQ
jgi:hypothetical protein